MEDQLLDMSATEPLKTIATDYGSAVVHYVTANDHGAQPILVFAWVEFLPVEVPPPPVTTESYRSGSWAVTVRRTVLPVQSALEWYLAVRDGPIQLPGSDAPMLVAGALAEEPRWPRLVCSGAMLPFVPPWIEDARVHHLLLAQEGDGYAIWPTAEARSVGIAAVSRHLHFSLDDYPEYVGSTHLVAPNPLFRKVHQELWTRDDRDEVRVVLERRFSGADNSGVEYTVTEQRTTGKVIALGGVAPRQMVMAFPGNVEMLGINIVDRARGTLMVESSRAFLRQFNMAMSMGETPRKIRTRNGEYEVSQRGREMRQTMAMAAAPTQTAAQRITQGKEGRRERAAARSDRQFWLHNRGEAQDIVREIIHRANKKVTIVDPWFETADLFEFALALGTAEVAVEILASPFGLKRRKHPAPARSASTWLRAAASRAAATWRETRTLPLTRRVPFVARRALEDPSRRSDPQIEGHRLHREITSLRKQGVANSIEVRVMSAKPECHDRFIFCDEKVWSIGSSLNHLGNRAAVILRLPAPEQARDEIAVIWKKSTTLETWLRTEAGALEAS